MWGIRLLNTPSAGKILALRDGRSTVGRSPHCEVQLPYDAVSKEHASVAVEGEALTITDLGSRNGTFVNGIRVSRKVLRAGDRIGFHHVVAELVQLPENWRPDQVVGGMLAPAWAGPAVMKFQNQIIASASQSLVSPSPFPPLAAVPDMQSDGEEVDSSVVATGGVSSQVNDYLERVFWPGIDQLPKTLGSRQTVLILLVVLSIVSTTIGLAPVTSATRESVRIESLRRARSIARNLAAANRLAVLEKNEIATSIRLAEIEEGVRTAVIISRDGIIIAPAVKRGEFANLPFVSAARREDHETSEFIDEKTIGAAAPILQLNSDAGSQEAVAFAVVIYEMGAMAVDSSKVLSLFLQIFFMTLAASALIYLIISRVMERPLIELNSEVDRALRDGRDDVTSDYKVPPLEPLITNINSALTRAAAARNSGNLVLGTARRDVEAQNMMRVVSEPALAIDGSTEEIMAANGAFESLIGSGVQLEHQGIDAIPDPALQANLRDLIPRMRSRTGEIALSDIPFSGEVYEINGQAIANTDGSPAWFFILLHRKGA